MVNKQGYVDPDPFGIETDQLVSKRKECIARLKSVETKIGELKKKKKIIFDEIKSVNAKNEKPELASRTLLEEIVDADAQVKGSKYFFEEKNQKDLIRSLRSEIKLKITKICEAEREQEKLTERVEVLFKEWLEVNREIYYLINVREKEYNNYIGVLCALSNDFDVKW